MDLLDISKPLEPHPPRHPQRPEGSRAALPAAGRGRRAYGGRLRQQYPGRRRLSQSTVSDYLATLQRAGLVEVRRIGQWTYYKRNEANISAFAKLIGKEL